MRRTRKKGGQLAIAEGSFEAPETVQPLNSGLSSSKQVAQTSRSTSPVSRQAAPSFRKFKADVLSPITTQSSVEEIKIAEPSKLEVLNPTIPKQTKESTRRLSRDNGTRRLSAGRKLRRRHSKPRHTVRRKRSQRK